MQEYFEAHYSSSMGMRVSGCCFASSLYARFSVEYFGGNQEYDVQEADDNDKPRIKMLLQKGYNPVLNINGGGIYYFRKAK
jgi:hypothetical protein